MKIGIMGAMPEEIISILSHMTGVQTISLGDDQYHLGKMNGHEIVLTFSGWGKVAAASTATTLIDQFEIDQLIFTGVAGASTPDLNIGDIVVSSQLYQHDMNAFPLFPKHQVPRTGITFFNADPVLVKNAHRASMVLFSEKSRIEVIEKLKMLGVTHPNPKCIVGTIATGDQFIASAEKIAEIVHEQPSTLAVEMEGAAVAQVCHKRKKPFVVIRTISDGADHLAMNKFQSFIEEVAKYYSEKIVAVMLSASNAEHMDEAVCAILKAQTL